MLLFHDPVKVSHDKDVKKRKKKKDTMFSMTTAFSPECSLAKTEGGSGALSHIIVSLKQEDKPLRDPVTLWLEKKKSQMLQVFSLCFITFAQIHLRSQTMQITFQFILSMAYTVFIETNFHFLLKTNTHINILVSYLL